MAAEFEVFEEEDQEEEGLELADLEEEDQSVENLELEDLAAEEKEEGGLDSRSPYKAFPLLQTHSDPQMENARKSRHVWSLWPL